MLETSIEKEGDTVRLLPAHALGMRPGCAKQASWENT
jgi:hypothetical protein